MHIALMFFQKHTDAISVTVIASTEPVVTLLLSVLLPVSYGGMAGLNFIDKKMDKAKEHGTYEVK